MLLRLNSEMFSDPKYECCTTQEVFDEIFQTRRFKEKYPWRINYRHAIKPISAGIVVNTARYKNVEMAVNISANNKSNYNLSKEDKSVVILSQLLPDIKEGVNEVAISTTDTILKNFSEDEFDIENIEPLAVVNSWLRRGVWQFDPSSHISIFKEWLAHEPPPSYAAKRDFKNLTGRDFPK